MVTVSDAFGAAVAGTAVTVAGPGVGVDEGDPVFSNSIGLNPMVTGDPGVIVMIFPSRSR